MGEVIFEIKQSMVQVTGRKLQKIAVGQIGSIYIKSTVTSSASHSTHIFKYIIHQRKRINA